MIVVMKRNAARLPRTATFFQGAVIEVTGRAQLRSEKFSLFPGRIQAIFVGEAQLFSLLGFDVFANRSGAHLPHGARIVIS